MNSNSPLMSGHLVRVAGRPGAALLHGQVAAAHRGHALVWRHAPERLEPRGALGGGTSEEFGEGAGTHRRCGGSVAVRARLAAGPRLSRYAAAGSAVAPAARGAARNSTLPMTPMAERLAPSSATQWR